MSLQAVDIKGNAELIRSSEHAIWRWRCHNQRSWPPRLLVLISRC
ncbi:hypothetical protein LINGRAHAP2_LOCUS25013 [Linum grandiflorum]